MYSRDRIFNQIILTFAPTTDLARLESAISSIIGRVQQTLRGWWGQKSGFYAKMGNAHFCSPMGHGGGDSK